MRGIATYISRRLHQPSTWLGVASILATLIAHEGTFDWDLIGGFVLALGLVHVDEAGPGKGDAPQTTNRADL